VNTTIKFLVEFWYSGKSVLVQNLTMGKSSWQILLSRADSVACGNCNLEKDALLWL